jgi:hypothetical protein
VTRFVTSVQFAWFTTGAIHDDLHNNPTQTFGPEGGVVDAAISSGDPDRSSAHASLIERVAQDGTPFFVGRQYSGVANNDGSLWLAVNDSYDQDNSGSYTVTVDTG